MPKTTDAVTAEARTRQGQRWGKAELTKRQHHSSPVSIVTTNKLHSLSAIY